MKLAYSTHMGCSGSPERNYTLRVLLVEDDINLGSLLCEFLTVKGFSVNQAFNGAEGFEQFSRKKFDICLIDVMMPKMDGFTLAKKIRTIDKGTPFLFLTAKSMLDDKIEGFKLGADDYVTKPFSMEELILRVNAIVKRTKKMEEENYQGTFEIGCYTFNYEKRILAAGKKEQKPSLSWPNNSQTKQEEPENRSKPNR